MIDFFKDWLPQIIGYAELVTDGTLRKAWETGDTTQTSTYYSGELDQQVFEDLHAEEMGAEIRARLHDHPELLDAIEAFLRSIARLVAWADAHVDVETWGRGKTIPASVSSIFYSEAWHDTEARAAQLLASANEGGFSSHCVSFS